MLTTMNSHSGIGQIGFQGWKDKKVRKNVNRTLLALSLAQPLVLGGVSYHARHPQVVVRNCGTALAKLPSGAEKVAQYSTPDGVKVTCYRGKGTATMDEWGVFGGTKSYKIPK